MGYTYVISDIHGRRDSFYDILRQIELKPEDKLYILGDVIDRGPHGIEILKHIMNMPNAEMILGNHEYMMLNALGEPYDGIEKNISRCCDLWYSNGGRVTHMSWLFLSKSEKKEIINYLRSLPLNIDIEAAGKKYRLVHAADGEFHSRYIDAHNSLAEFCVWERKALADMEEADRSYVFGHTITFMFESSENPKIWHNKNLIGIDCGCAIRDGYYVPEIGFVRGKLGCIRLEDMREYYSDTQMTEEQ